jgi:hypothetical protein
MTQKTTQVKKSWSFAEQSVFASSIPSSMHLDTKILYPEEGLYLHVLVLGKVSRIQETKEFRHKERELRSLCEKIY